MFLEECPDDDIAKIFVHEWHSWNDLLSNNEFLDRRLFLKHEYLMMNSVILVVPWLLITVNELCLVPFIDPLSAVANSCGEASSSLRCPSQKFLNKDLLQVAPKTAVVELAMRFGY